MRSLTTRSWLRAAARVVAPMLGACWAAATVAPAQAAPSWLATQYDRSPMQAVDILMPPAPRGLVVWVHGGGWSDGDKADERRRLEPLAALNLAVVNMNYRLGKAGAFPAAVQDVQAVLNAVESGGCPTCVQPDYWRRLQAAAQGGILVAGADAGGYLASYAAGERVSLLPQTKVRCVNSVVGFFDLRRAESLPLGSRDQVRLFTNDRMRADELARMSPLHQIENGTWRNFQQLQWYFHLSQNDQLLPLEMQVPAPSLLYAKGAPVFRTVSVQLADGGHAMAPEDYKAAIERPVKHCFGLLDK